MDAVLLAEVFGRARPGLFLFGILIPLAIVALVAYGIWELARSRSVVPASGPAGSARVLLDERFARGEIDADEYVQRRSLLDGTPMAAPTAPPVAPEAQVADATATTEQPVALAEDPASDPTAG